MKKNILILEVIHFIWFHQLDTKKDVDLYLWTFTSSGMLSKGRTLYLNLEVVEKNVSHCP